MANSITGSFRNPGNWRTHPLQRPEMPTVGSAGVSNGYVDPSLVTVVPKGQRQRKRDLNAALAEQEIEARREAKRRRKSKHRQKLANNA